MRLQGHTASLKQNGVALITVLLVFFIASALTVGMLESQSINIQRTTNIVNQSQLLQFTLAGEEVAKIILSEDYENDAADYDANGNAIFRDSLQEKWAEPLLLEMQEGKLDLKIVDLQSVFNMNSLYSSATQRDPVTVASFQRLLRALAIEPKEGDTENRLDNYFKDNGRAFTFSEFATLLSLDFEDTQLLSTCATALPITRLNINTASEVILSAWESLIVPNVREDILLQRQGEEGLLAVPSIPGDIERFSINSEYFKLILSSEVEGKEMHMESILYRNSDSGEVSTVSRLISPFPTYGVESPCNNTQEEYSL